MDKCTDPKNPFKILGFMIIDVLNNAEHLSRYSIENLLPRKEDF